MKKNGMREKLKRGFAVAMAVAVGLSFSWSLPAVGEGILPESGVDEVYAAQSYSDIGGHWAQYYIMNASYYGIISGYGNSSKFKPDAKVTRAEFATMVNNTFNNVLTYDTNFSDVPKTIWYYNDICKSVSSGITSGYENGKYKPDKNITRQEAAVIVSRLLPPVGLMSSLGSYKDGGSVATWAKDAMCRVIAENIMGTYDDGKLHPGDGLTRAQAVTILCKLKEKKNIIEDDLKVTVGGVTFKGKIFSNSVHISEKIGDESVTFDNCVIMGPLKIEGGGDKSIHLIDTHVNLVEVEKPSGTVRVVSKGDTYVGAAELYKSVILETDNMPKMMKEYGDYGFRRVLVHEGANVSLTGYYPDVEIVGGNTSTHLNEGEIEKFYVMEDCDNASVTLDKGTSVDVASVASKSDFHGTGTITKMLAGTKDITYETAPDTVTMGEDVRVNPVKVNAEIAVASNPANNETGVPFNTKIVLTFNQTLYRTSGKDMTDDYAKSHIKLTSKKATGTPVDYTFSRNAAGNVITLKPDAPLSKKTKYYITIDKDVFGGETKGVTNKKISIVFTTGDGTIDGVKFKPEDGSAGAKTSVKPTITFAEPIEAYDVEREIDEQYLKKAILFYTYDDDEDSEDHIGKKVAFTAEINKKLKVITITPTSPLTDNTKYIVGFADKKFRYASTHNALNSQSIYMSVGYTIPEVTFDPEYAPRKIPTIGLDETIDISFNEPMYTKDTKELTKAYVKSSIEWTDSAGNAVAFDVVKLETDKDTTFIRIVPTRNLVEGETYTVAVPENKFYNKNKKSNALSEAIYSTALNTPVASGLTAVGVSGSVTATVSSNMSGTAYVAVTDSNNAMDAAQVRANGTSGTVTAGSNYITVNSSNIKGGKTYTVYAVIVNGSYVSDVLTTRVTTTFDEAKVTSVDLTGLTAVSGSGVTAVNVPVDDTMNLVIESATCEAIAGMKLAITADRNTTILFYDGSSYYETKDITTSGSDYVSSITLTASDVATLMSGGTVTVKFKAVSDRKSDKMYVVNIKRI